MDAWTQCELARKLRRRTHSGGSAPGCLRRIPDNAHCLLYRGQQWLHLILHGANSTHQHEDRVALKNRHTYHEHGQHHEEDIEYFRQVMKDRGQDDAPNDDYQQAHYDKNRVPDYTSHNNASNTSLKMSLSL